LNECLWFTKCNKGSPESLLTSISYSVKKIIGEMDEIHLSKPYLNEKNEWVCKNLDQSTIWNQINKNRGKFDGKSSQIVLGLIDIVKYSREEMSGLDLSNLNLTKVNLSNLVCSRTNQNDNLVVSFDKSIINEKVIIQSGHNHYVLSVAFSPDGKTCLSGSGDKTLKLWNVKTGECLRTFIGHNHHIHGVAFSPDGKKCLSGSWDNTLKLWNVQTGECLWSRLLHPGLYLLGCSMKNLHPDSLLSEESKKILQHNGVIF